LSYQIDWTESGAVVVFSGSISIVEIDQCDYEIYSNPKYNELAYVLYDFISAELGSIELDDVKRTGVANLEMIRKNRNLRFAMIAEGGENKKVAKTYKDFCESNHFYWDIGLFSDHDDGIKWARQLV